MRAEVSPSHFIFAASPPQSSPPQSVQSVSNETQPKIFQFKWRALADSSENTLYMSEGICPERFYPDGVIFGGDFVRRRLMMSGYSEECVFTVTRLSQFFNSMLNALFM